MSHEFIVRNGLIVQNTLNFMGSSEIATGITIGTLNGNQWLLATDKSVKDYVDSRTLDLLSGVTITSPQIHDVLAYVDGEWRNTGVSFSMDNYYTKTEADVKFVDVAGDTMTGDLNISNANFNITGTSTFYGDIVIPTGLVDGVDISTFYSTFLSHTAQTLNRVANSANVTTTDGDILYFNGTNWVSTANTWLDQFYYHKDVADNRFVNVSGDTMTGPLIVTSAGEYALTINGNALMNGNLFVSGTTTTINSENLGVKDNIITINSGETESGVTLGYAGITIERGWLPNYVFIFEESSDTFRIGETGSTHAVATREDVPNASGIAFWNNVQSRFDTFSNFTWNGTNLNVGSGTVDGVDISTFYSTFLSHTAQTLNRVANSANITTTDGDILYFNGSNWVSTANTWLDQFYYHKDVADNRFVNVSGDTMTGNLNLNSTLVVTGASTFYGDLTVNANIIITGTVDGVDVSAFKSDFDSHNHKLTGLTDVFTNSLIYKDVLYYSAGTWKNASITALVDADYVNTAGDTMTGNLTITPLAGTDNRLVFVDTNGQLSQSNEYIFKTTQNALGAGTSTGDTFLKTDSKAVEWMYVIDDGTNFRAGTILAVWNSGSTVEFNETTTRDIGTTNNINFNVDIVGSNVRLLIVVVSGTWSVSTSRFMIG